MHTIIIQYLEIKVLLNRVVQNPNTNLKKNAIDPHATRPEVDTQPDPKPTYFHSNQKCESKPEIKGN